MKNGLAVLLVLCSLLLLACTDPGATTPGISNIIEVTENITAVTTWETGNLFLIRKSDFYVENTLSIQPGVIVKFHPADGAYMMLGSGGTLVAEGTEEDPIIFTSYRDDTHGGDTNGDGDLTSPAVQDWGKIDLQDINGNTLDYCEFYYGGDISYNQTLAASGSNNTVTNCKFINNAGSYNNIGVLDFSNAGTGNIIQNNIFYDNERPLSVSTNFDLDDSNIFHNPDDLTVTNEFNGIFVYDLDDPIPNLSWQETEVAYVIDDNDLWISDTLVLGDNVVIKFRNNSALVLEGGESEISNRSGTGVAFTSFKDDSKKGDTNGDGTITSASAGDWDGIYDDTATADPHYFSWSNILYDSY